MTFEREDRYLVLRWDDINNALLEGERNILLYISEQIEDYRRSKGKDPYPKFVCVKDTYPEYEMVWAAIEKRMTKGNE